MSISKPKPKLVLLLVVCIWVVVLLVVIVSPMANAATSKQKILTFTSTKVAFNPEYLQNHTLAINPDGSTLNIILNVARNFPQDPWVEVSIALRQDGAGAKKQHGKGTTARGKATTTRTAGAGIEVDGAYRSLFNYDINVCNILGKSTAVDRLNLIQLWLNNFMKYGTLPKSCPILKGNYYWRGLKIDRMSLPGFLLNGYYRAYVRTYFPPSQPHHSKQQSKVHVANLSIYLTITEMKSTQQKQVAGKLID